MSMRISVIVVCVVTFLTLPCGFADEPKAERKTIVAEDDLSKEHLASAALAIKGQYTEQDFLGPKTKQWTGSACALAYIRETNPETEETKAMLVAATNSHCLAIHRLATEDQDTDIAVEVKSYVLQVKFPSGTTRRVIGFVETQRSLDLALIMIDATDLEEGRDFVLLKERHRMKIEAGDDIVVVGSPRELHGTQTFGKISAIRVFEEGESKNKYIQTDAAINPGNSGGPVFVKSTEGDKETYRWVGVATSKLAGDDNLGFAVHVSELPKTDAEMKYWHMFSANAEGAAKAVTQLHKVKASLFKE